MIEQARPEPKRSLVAVHVRRGKLIGYRRLARQPPAVLLPVFWDADDFSNKLLLYQRTDDNDNVLSFICDPALTLRDIVFATEDDPVFVSVSSPSIHAYEVTEGDVIVSPADDFATKLRGLLDDELFTKRPFAGLEIAHFVQDPIAEQKFASSCTRSLMSRSPALAASWVAGTALSSAARSAAVDVMSRQRVDESLTDVRDGARPPAEDKPENDVERPQGLEWLKNADPNHGSWARVWREIWGSTKSDQHAKHEHEERAQRWLQVVNPNHMGWASVWVRLWEAADTRTRDNLVNHAHRWLKEVNPNHGRWGFIWLKLLDLAENDPAAHADLMGLAMEWLLVAPASSTGWASIWRKLWQSPFHADRRAFLEQRAKEWISRGDRRKGFWFELWNLLWNISSPQERDGLRTEGYDWLARNSIKPAWLQVWRLLWDDADAQEHEHLAAQAETWLNHSKTGRIWGDVWEAVWQLTLNDYDRHQKLKELADGWLAEASPDNSRWARVWQLLWDDGARDPARRAKLTEVGRKWLGSVSANDPQRGIIAQTVPTVDDKE
jgi:hypothetical protein